MKNIREYDEHQNSISENIISIINMHMWSPNCSSWGADNQILDFSPLCILGISLLIFRMKYPLKHVDE